MLNALNKIPVIKLANIPTPLEEAARLAGKLGLTKLLIKRDDLTGLAGGGNKARKLEYDFAHIVDGGYDVVITAGGIQSNHARMTAAAARKLGIDVKLVLGGPDYNSIKANFLLDVIFGAEIRYLVDDDSNESLTKAMEEWAEELIAKKYRPYILPIGGSSGLGSLGYVKAMNEIAEQFGGSKVQIILGVGSCGTFAGTILGCKMFLPKARVIGISVSRTARAIKERTKELIAECASLLEYELDIDEIKIECYDDYFNEYGIMTKESEQAIYNCANSEGILLDPIYTGKVMAGLTDLVDKNIIARDIPVIFIHTGGVPIIFSFEEELGRKVNCTKFSKS